MSRQRPPPTIPRTTRHSRRTPPSRRAERRLSSSDMSPTAGRSPRIVVTLAVAAASAEPALAARKNALYVDAVTRHGATAIPLDATASESARAGAFASMDGLLLTGGADIDPARYGQAPGSGHRDRRGARRAGGGGLRGRRLARAAGAGDLPRPPGDERVRRRHADPARGRPRGSGLGTRGGADAPAAARAGIAARADPQPRQRGRRGADREQLPPPGGAGVGPRRQRTWRPAGRRARPGTSSRRSRRRPGRSGWPCSATPSARSPRPRRSSGCSRSSWMRAGGHSRADSGSVSAPGFPPPGPTPALGRRPRPRAAAGRTLGRALGTRPRAARGPDHSSTTIDRQSGAEDGVTSAGP